jgi:hypothetical protein
MPARPGGIRAARAGLGLLAGWCPLLDRRPPALGPPFHAWGVVARRCTQREWLPLRATSTLDSYVFALGFVV